MRRTPALAFVLLALALLAPAAASALTLGPGHHPHVAVNSSGAGFFTWTEPVGAQDKFHYCRIPAGGTACNASLTSSPGDTDVDGGYALLPGDGRVLLLNARCCAHYADKKVFTSTDGGGVFGAAVQPGYMNGAGDNIAGNAIYAPAGAVGRAGESLLTVSDVQTVGVTFQATGTGAGSETTTANLGGGGGSYQGSLALQGTGTLVATYGTLSPANLYWRMWRGSGDVNDVSNWTAPELLDSTNVNSTAKLVSGPSGLYVAYSYGDTNNARYVLRKFTGSFWSARMTISEVGNPSNGDLSEDSAGVLHFAWQDGNGALRYRYARSAANADFTRAQTVAGPNGNFPFLKLAVSASSAGGAGWVTWDNGGIQVQPLGPGEPALPVYSGPTKTTKTSVGADRLIMTFPKACVTPAATFTAKLAAKAKKKHKKAKVKIKKVVFSVDGKTVGTDKKKPFSFAVPTSGLASGSHKLKAKVTATIKKNGKKKTIKKTLKGVFAIC